MNRRIFIAAVSLLVLGACSLSPAEYDARTQKGPQKVTAKLEKNHVEVTVGGKLFTRYKFDASLKYPYFWPVCGPVSNKSVTTETSEPYPHHHSLFFGCDRVNGGNYWQDVNERGQIVSQGP
jgi:hypothetical protein